MNCGHVYKCIKSHQAAFLSAGIANGLSLHRPQNPGLDARLSIAGVSMMCVYAFSEIFAESRVAPS